MTVLELITQLVQQDMDAEVSILTDDGTVDVDGISTHTNADQIILSPDKTLIEKP